jgi:hypothetical protein
MKRAMIAVSARPSEAGEDGAEIVAASPDSGSFGPIRPRTNALDQDLPPNVRCGSIASLWPSADYFRSSPVNGRRQGQ